MKVSSLYGGLNLTSPAIKLISTVVKREKQSPFSGDLDAEFLLDFCYMTVNNIFKYDSL
jgi:hypothetical protein